MPNSKRRGIQSQTTLIVTPFQASEELWPVGSLIDGQYRVKAIRGGAGISGMGVVYIVERDGKRLAAKTFQRQFARDLPLIQRFMREAETWMLIDAHPNIVRAHYLDIIETVPFIFMEYIQHDEHGCLSLADHIARGRASYTQAIDWALQCCDGMLHATSAVPGLVHRDLKPENLLISPDGAVKITDFGLVRWHMQEASELPDLTADVEIEDDRLTQAGSSLGTPAYMAPEQFLAPGRVEIPADIYAFGCILYEVIAGQRLFTIRADSNVERVRNIKNAHLHQKPIPLRIRAADCPPGLNDIVMRCLEKAPEDRWSNFGDVKLALCEVMEHECGCAYTPKHRQMMSPVEVADQVRSLRLVDGYSKAMQSKNLRENYQHSPYSFHLALASYFHTQRDHDEEQRQLERALRVRTGQEGHEAVRRLADLLVFKRELNQADVVLGAYLSSDRNPPHAVLEPLVRLRICQGRTAEAWGILAGCQDSPRVFWLQVEIARAQEIPEEEAAALCRLVRAYASNLKHAIKQIETNQAIGVEEDGDAAVLKQFLDTMCEDTDTATLDSVREAPWPSMSGYPDFSADMAWLSKAVGELAQVQCTTAAIEPTLARTLAKLLGYPARHEQFLRRDEEWLWSSAF